ncbi:hypothetical protein Bca4012_002391 [Brassica carinata]
MLFFGLSYSVVLLSALTWRVSPVNHLLVWSDDSGGYLLHLESRSVAYPWCRHVKRGKSHNFLVLVSKDGFGVGTRTCDLSSVCFDNACIRKAIGGNDKSELRRLGVLVFYKWMFPVLLGMFVSYPDMGFTRLSLGSCVWDVLLSAS